MPTSVDFRTLPFEPRKVSDSGRYIGQSTYWKLYAIENLFRVVIHSVLLAQMGPNWWALVVDGKTNDTVQSIKKDYAKQPGSTTPGSHDIYYLFLRDLNKIITSQSNLFRPLVPDIDQWIIKLEQIRLPRNIVGHMNWPSATDRRRIDNTYKEAKILIRRFSTSGTNVVIP